MKNQLLSICVLVSIAGFGVKSFAEAASSGKDAMSAISKKDKKTTEKKKVAMCSECGKPESDCTCDHEKKEHKDNQHLEGSEKKSSDHSHSH